MVVCHDVGEDVAGIVPRTREHDRFGREYVTGPTPKSYIKVKRISIPPIAQTDARVVANDRQPTINKMTNWQKSPPKWIFLRPTCAMRNQEAAVLTIPKAEFAMEREKEFAGSMPACTKKKEK